MKRLFAVIAGLLVLPAFAEVAPAYYYEELMAQYADQMPDTEFVDETVVDEPADETPESKPVTPVTPTTPSPRNSSGRATASRSMVNSNTVSSRGVASRNKHGCKSCGIKCSFGPHKFNTSDIWGDNTYIYTYNNKSGTCVNRSNGYCKYTAVYQWARRGQYE